jgi:hypothetical protein
MSTFHSFNDKKRSMGAPCDRANQPADCLIGAHCVRLIRAFITRCRFVCVFVTHRSVAPQTTASAVDCFTATNLLVDTPMGRSRYWLAATIVLPNRFIRMQIQFGYEQQHSSVVCLDRTIDVQYISGLALRWRYCLLVGPAAQ